MAKYAGIIAGAALVAGGMLVGVLSGGTLLPLATYMAAAGYGMIIGNVGTLLSKGPLQGFGTASRNPIAPWGVIYGQAKVGGTVIFLNEWGSDNNYMDMVIVLAAHQCRSVDALLFDQQRVVFQPADGGMSQNSIKPSQQTYNILHVARTGGVAEVTVSADLLWLQTGDFVIISGVSDATFLGRTNITVTGLRTFSYICGGPDTGDYGPYGTVKTSWADYGNLVHMQVLLGDQASTFPWMLDGMPNADGEIVGPGHGSTPGPNPWTSDHKLLGKTCVLLRLRYDQTVFANGLPSIAFLVSGKCDIMDPRTSPISYGYTTNAALCIADYLANTQWGFKAAYGTEIPLDRLTAAANICDEVVPLEAGGTELRYTCNGQFTLDGNRGEILSNLLTSCGGRLTYSGGRFVIHPAAWEGSTGAIQVDGRCVPWRVGGGINSAYDVTGIDTGLNPVSVGVVSGTPIELQWVSGLAGIGDPFPLTDANGQPGTDGNALSNAGQYCPTRVNYGCLLGAFADSTGQILSVVSVGNEATLVPPEGATQLLLGMNDGVSWSDNQGSWSIRIGPDIYGYLDMSNMAGPFIWKPQLASRDLYNGAKGTYISPVNSWQSSDIPPYAQDPDHGYTTDANLAADGGDRRWKDVQLPFTTSASMAQRLCKIELCRSRQQGSGTFAFNMTAYRIEALDIVSLTVPYLGWTSKTLEVAAQRFKLDRAQGESGGEAVLLGTELDVQESSASIYEWSTAEELGSQGQSQGGSGGGSGSGSIGIPTPPTIPGVPGMVVVPPPTNLILESDQSTQNRAGDNQILATWTPTTDAMVTNFGRQELQWKLTSASTYEPTVVLGPTASLYYISPVIEGLQYDVQVRAVNTAGAASEWVQASITVYDQAGIPIPIVAVWQVPPPWTPSSLTTPIGVPDGMNGLADDFIVLAETDCVDLRGHGQTWVSPASPGGTVVFRMIRSTNDGLTWSTACELAIAEGSTNTELQASFSASPQPLHLSIGDRLNMILVEGSALTLQSWIVELRGNPTG